MKTILNTVMTALAFGAFCLTLGYQQGSDAKWAVLEAEQAASKSAYANGYSKGSSAALSATYQACGSMAHVAACDKLLAQTVVAYADEVQ